MIACVARRSRCESGVNIVSIINDRNNCHTPIVVNKRTLMEGRPLNDNVINPYPHLLGARDALVHCLNVEFVVSAPILHEIQVNQSINLLPNARRS